MGQHWRMGTKTVQSEGAGCCGVFGVPCRLGNSEVSQINAALQALREAFGLAAKGLKSADPTAPVNSTSLA
jgi:hypothetical protein